jgi:hypothetical protein
VASVHDGPNCVKGVDATIQSTFDTVLGAASMKTAKRIELGRPSQGHFDTGNTVVSSVTDKSYNALSPWYEGGFPDTIKTIYAIANKPAKKRSVSTSILNNWP